MGLQGWCFGGPALHPFPSLSHSAALQISFLSLTQWPLRQDESEQGAGDMQGPIQHSSGGDLETQPQLLTVLVNSSVLTDLNLLGGTPNSPPWSRGS